MAERTGHGDERERVFPGIPGHVSVPRAIGTLGHGERVKARADRTVGESASLVSPVDGIPSLPDKLLGPYSLL